MDYLCSLRKHKWYTWENWVRARPFLRIYDRLGWESVFPDLYYRYFHAARDRPDWERAVEQFNSFNPRSRPAPSDDDLREGRQELLDKVPFVSGGLNYQLCVVQRPHRLLIPGDVLIMLPNNGMNERYPMWGVSSKGARLDCYWRTVDKPPRSGAVRLVGLPDDFIGRRWDDPAIGRFVADLRASSRSRVGASSPAPPLPTASSHHPGGALRFDGIYQSGNVSERRRGNRSWSYLRFYQDGTVVNATAYEQPSEVRRWLDKDHGVVSKGSVSLSMGRVSFSVSSPMGVVDYSGEIDGDRLRLAVHSHINGRRFDRIYRFVACPDEQTRS